MLERFHRYLNPLGKAIAVGFILFICSLFPLLFIAFAYMAWRYLQFLNRLKDPESERFSVRESGKEAWHSSGLFSSIIGAHSAIQRLKMDSFKKNIHKATEHFNSLQGIIGLTDEEIWFALSECSPNKQEVEFAKEFVDYELEKTWDGDGKIVRGRYCTPEQSTRKLRYILSRYTDKPLLPEYLKDVVEDRNA